MRPVPAGPTKAASGAPAKAAKAPSQVAAVAAAAPASEPAWQTVQRRTFTRWSNAVLRVRCFELKDVVLDLEDGLALIHLIELLTNESVGSKFNRVPRHRAQKLENVMIALKFIDSKKIKLVGIGPEDIVEQKPTLVLGLIWTLILHFQVSIKGNNKDELLAWVQSQLASVMKITNLTSDFKDGRALVALLKSVNPQANVQYKDPKSSVAEAFNKAEQLCGIPQLLNVEDMTEVADDLSNRTYLSYFRDYASRNQDKNLVLRPIEVQLMAKRVQKAPSDCFCSILNKDHSYRAHIGSDGTVVSNFGVVLGYINIDASEVASADEFFLGQVRSDQVYDESETDVGSINRGVGSVHDVLGSTVFQIDATGKASGLTGVHLGSFNGLSRPFAAINVLALYVLFLDPCFAREDIDK